MSAWIHILGRKAGSRSRVTFRAGGRSGQAMVEYAIVAGMMVLAASVLAVFLYAFREYGGRVLDLVASEYP